MRLAPVLFAGALSLAVVLTAGSGFGQQSPNQPTPAVVVIPARVENIAPVSSFIGHVLVSGAQESNAGSVIAIMQSWDRQPESQSTVNVIERLRPTLNAIPAANIVSFNPPAIPGISTTGGINFVLEGRNGQSYQDLAQVSRAVIFAANQNPDLSSVFTSFSANVPQLRVDIDTAKAALLGVTPLAIYQTLQANLGGQFVNLFNYQNYAFQVVVQDEAQFRQKTSDIANLYVRSSAGKMVPLEGLVTVSEVLGPNSVNTYNLFPAVLINGAAASGRSSGQAIAAMEQVAKQHLPQGYGYEWTAMSYQELQAAGQQAAAFLAAIVFSYLFLVAQYESWTLPLSVMLPVGFALLGGLGAIMARGLALDVYGQISLVLLIGLSAKNAILIVEFARERMIQEHIPPRQAADKARGPATVR